jgi:hypothetical protein
MYFPFYKFPNAILRQGVLAWYVGAIMNEKHAAEARKMDENFMIFS